MDESKQASPSNDSNVSQNPSRKNFNHPSSPQLSLFGPSDRRKTVPPMSKSSLDVSRPFPIAEIPPPPMPPLPPPPPPPTETELSQNHKAPTLRRSFSLFKRKTPSQTNSPVPATSKPAKSSWRRFRSSSKTSVQSPTSSNEATEPPPPQNVNQVPPRPTRPVPPVPQESPLAPESEKPNQPTRTLRRHNRSASLQEAHIPCTEPPSSIGWNMNTPMRRGGMSLDMNHVVGSVESSTRSSHNPFTTGERRERTPTVRDLAILPTQRVMRYVLLFKGS